MSLKYQITQEFIKCIGFLFVDNTDLIVIEYDEEELEDICVRQQQSLTC